MSKTAHHLKTIIDTIRPRLQALTDEQAARRPTPDKWSTKEIIGHLVDSASNNHQRFIRAQFTDELIFDGYRQEEWVKLQDYARADWQNLVQLWYYFNWQMARVIARVPDPVRHQLRPRHNLDKIAMRKVMPLKSVSLEYFMEDYVKHLEHHLQQIFPDYEPQLR
ncbi:DinB family protein [Flavilitoribacter nigricans]|nr:DinB family protein [Flavilitoribacter nigricans]